MAYLIGHRSEKNNFLVDENIYMYEFLLIILVILCLSQVGPIKETQLFYKDKPIPRQRYFQNQPQLSNTFYPRIISGFSYPFTSTETISCLTNEHNVQKCHIHKTKFDYRCSLYTC